MATRTITPSKVVWGLHKWSWDTLTTTNSDGAPITPELGGGTFTDRTVQVTGTPGVGGTLVIEGSNDNVNWETLTDPLGNPLSFTAAGIKTILENPLYTRPNVTAGDGSTDFDVVIAGRGNLHFR